MGFHASTLPRRIRVIVANGCHVIFTDNISSIQSKFTFMSSHIYWPARIGGANLKLKP